LLTIAVFLAVTVPAGATTTYSTVLTFKGTETPPGSFGETIGLAVDDDPGSASSGDLYTTDKFAKHDVVSRFEFPSTTTNKFACILNGTFLGLPTTPCAANTASFTANVTSGSTKLAAVSAFSGFALNATVAGAGITTGTTITSINTATKEITLSAAATATGTGVALTASAGFTATTGVAVNDSGDVWAANEAAAPVLDEFSPVGVFMGAITESLLAGQAPATFSKLRGVAAGPNGEVYVDDAGNNVVDKFVETSPGSGTYEFSCHLNATGTNSSLCGGVGTTTTTAFATLTNSNDLAVDSNGNVYVVSAGLVDKFNSSGGFMETIGSGTASAVAVNPTTNNLYVGYGTIIKEYCEETSCATPGSLLNEFSGPSGTLGAKGTSGLAVNAATVHTRVFAGNDTGGKEDVVVFESATSPTPVTEPCPSPGRQTIELEMKGTINPEGLAATSLFEYGETTSYGSTVASSPSNDGSGDGPVTVTAKVTGLVPHTLYHYRVHASNSELPANGLDVTCETLIAAPAVNDQPVSAVSITDSASAPATTFLSGTLNAEHDPATYRFVYGTASAFEQSTPTVDGGSAYGDVEAAQTVEGLQPNTTYHYALVANNEAGMESISNEGTFTTQPEDIAPLVQTGSPEAIAGEVATATGTVDPRGLPTSYEIEFGTDTGYGTEIFGEAGSGTSTIPIAVTLQALSPGTTYHYRLVATNTGGTTYGADETFTTPAGPSVVLIQPLTPVLVPIPRIVEVKEPAAKKATTKTLTKAQKLKAALKVCRNDKNKPKRTKCEKQARKKYAPVKTTKKSKGKKKK
jgi:hypothetical protein